MFYFARCMYIIFNSRLAQLVKYDVNTTRKIKSIHAIFITYYYFIQRKALRKTNTSVTCLWNIRLVSSAASAFNKELDRRVSIAKLCLNILGKDGPVEMVSTE